MATTGARTERLGSRNSDRCSRTPPVIISLADVVNESTRAIAKHRLVGCPFDLAALTDAHAEARDLCAADEYDEPAAHFFALGARYERLGPLFPALPIVIARRAAARAIMLATNSELAELLADIADGSADWRLVRKQWVTWRANADDHR